MTQVKIPNDPLQALCDGWRLKNYLGASWESNVSGNKLTSVINETGQLIAIDPTVMQSFISVLKYKQFVSATENKESKNVSFDKTNTN